MTADSDQTYWRFHNELSNFPRDFKGEQIIDRYV